MLICVFVLSGGYAVLPAVLALLQTSGMEPPVPALDDPGTMRSVYNGGNTLARILALVVGIMTMGGEYRHKTMAVTYLATPRRVRVLAAKAAALFGYGLLYGAASVVAGVLVAVPFVLSQDASFYLDRAETWRSLGLGIFSIALWAMIGFGVGTLFRNMIIAMLVGIGFAYLVEPSLTAVFFLQEWSIALNLMPTGATNAMLEVTSPILLASADPFLWWQGLLVLLGWSLLPAILGVLLTLGKDVD